MHEEQCVCETCRNRKRIEQLNSGKEIGMQYALWAFAEGHTLLVSAEEIEFLEEEDNQVVLETNGKDEMSIYTIAYGVFRSQTNWHDNFYDLTLAKGASYFYLDREFNQLREAAITDFIVISRDKNFAKVCLLLKTNKRLQFPKNSDELSITLTKLMPELGNQLSNLIFSRIEYGTFRLDQGMVIENENRAAWRKFVDESYFFEIEYDRLLIFSKEDE